VTVTVVPLMVQAVIQLAAVPPQDEQVAVPFRAYPAEHVWQAVALVHVAQPVGQATHPEGFVMKNPVAVHEVQTVFKVVLAHEAQPVTVEAQVA